jgi:restriction system protein
LEILTANLFESLGFNAKLTSVGADGGIDVILRKPGSELPVGIAQCKAWTTHKVGVKPIREFFGVMSAEKVEHGIFVTTSTFTDEAREFAEGKNLELIDGDTLISFIRQLPLDRKTALFDSTFSGDYSTPTCPNCDVKMVTRTARTGLFEGSSFWGCPHYPRCSHTFPMRKDKER